MKSLPIHSITSSARASKRWRHAEAERLGGLEIDDQLELGRLLDGQIGRLGALQDLVHLRSGTPVQVSIVRSVGHETASVHRFAEPGHRRQPILQRKLCNLRFGGL